MPIRVLDTAPDAPIRGRIMATGIALRTVFPAPAAEPLSATSWGIAMTVSPADFAFRINVSIARLIPRYQQVFRKNVPCLILAG
jgi:hypothetical protein